MDANRDSRGHVCNATHGASRVQLAPHGRNNTLHGISMLLMIGMPIGLTVRQTTEIMRSSKTAAAVMVVKKWEGTAARRNG